MCPVWPRARQFHVDVYDIVWVWRDSSIRLYRDITGPACHRNTRLYRRLEDKAVKESHVHSLSGEQSCVPSTDLTAPQITKIPEPTPVLTPAHVSILKGLTLNITASHGTGRVGSFFSFSLSTVGSTLLGQSVQSSEHPGMALFCLPVGALVWGFSSSGRHFVTKLKTEANIEMLKMKMLRRADVQTARIGETEEKDHDIRRIHWGTQMFGSIVG